MKPTRPAARDGAGGEQRRGDVDGERDARDAHAESGRGVLAEGEHVDRAREREQHDDAERDVPARESHLRPARVADGAHHPPERAAHDVVLRIRQRDHDRRVGERADDDAGHEDDARVAVSAGGARDDAA